MPSSWCTASLGLARPRATSSAPALAALPSRPPPFLPGKSMSAYASWSGMQRPASVPEDPTPSGGLEFQTGMGTGEEGHYPRNARSVVAGD